MKKLLVVVSSLLMMLSANQVCAEESDFGYSFGADIVSSYVYRGSTCSDGMAIQPGAEVSFKGLAFGVWASSDMDGETTTGVPSEADIYLSYSIGGLSVGVTHFYYFNDTEFFGDLTQTEAMLSYTISDELPLSLSWYTMVGGSDKYIEDAEEKRAFSSYVELGYSHSLPHDVSISYAVGVSPWKSVYSGFTEDVIVPNVSVRLDYELALGDVCTMGTFLQPTYNTFNSSFSCVLGCGFWFE